MKKRIFLAVVLATVLASGVFAQTHWISAEVSYLGGGLRYEYLLTPDFTVGAYFYWNNIPNWLDAENGENLGLGVALRWYPFARRFFTELGLGFNSQTYSSYWNERENINASGFGIVPGFGWTIDVGRAGGLFISPGIKLPFTLSNDSTRGEDDNIIVSAVLAFERAVTLVGPIIYFGFGYAF